MVAMRSRNYHDIIMIHFLNLSFMGDNLRNLRALTASVLDAFRQKDQKKLRKLYDHILKDALVELTKPMNDLAILSYILSKILSKPRFLGKENKQFFRQIEMDMRALLIAMSEENEREIEISFAKISDSINALERVDRRFVRNLISKGKLKTAATMYAQGISLGVASEMTGMSKQDVLDYAGKTMMFDRVKEEVSLKERLKNARRALE